MNKKYQVFISSTYEDLKAERQKIIDTVLSLNQFPVGMEMFAADNEEQWVTIKECIDCSDYYILIVGNRYGTIIDSGEYEGLSYTEKEFKYALSQNIPVLAFVIAGDAGGYPSEDDPEKVMKLVAFKQAVKYGRVVKFWHNADELATQVSISPSKAISRNNRPGWVRTTEFDVEKSLAEIVKLTERVHVLEALNSDLKIENNRKPELKIVCKRDIKEDGTVINDITVKDDVIKFKAEPVDVSDVNGELIYRDAVGHECKANVSEVKCFRFLCKNGFSVLFNIVNEGNARATGVKVEWKFPNDLMVLSMSEVMEAISEETIRFSEKAYENWDARFFEPEGVEACGDRFVSIDELTTVNEIAQLLDPATCEGTREDGCDIFPGKVEFRTKEIQHYSSTFFRGMYILPLAPGKYQVECNILCNEYAEPIKQIIEVWVE